MVDSTKLQLFYDVCVGEIVLEALGKFRTPIWFLAVSSHTYGF